MTRKPIFVRLATEARLKGNQSPLYRWFLQNHDQFAAVLAKISRPGWQSIADELSAEGLAMKDGAPLTASYARLTWWRAHRSFETKHPPRAVPKPIPATQGREVTHGVVPLAIVPTASVGTPPFRQPDPPPDDYEAPRPKVKIDFKPATFRNPTDKES